MLLLSRLKTVAGLLMAAVVAAGWVCAARDSAGAASGEGAAARSEDHSAAPAGTARGAESPAEEAEFVFRGTERDGKRVSLVVAGTSAPVLSLPVGDGLRVLVAGQRVGLHLLRPGERVTIRLDSANRVIRDIRTREVLDPDPNRTPVLPPVGSPSDAEVLRALPKLPGGVAPVFQVFRDDVSIVTECLLRKVDPPRNYPLVGKAELHHCHWKCTAYFTETVESGWPFPFLSKRPRVEVVYIDKDFLVQTR
jgi:hypothetical protein